MKLDTGTVKVIKKGYNKYYIKECVNDMFNSFPENVADRQRHSRLPTLPIGVSDSLPITLINVPLYEKFCCVQGVFNFDKSEAGY